MIYLYHFCIILERRRGQKGMLRFTNCQYQGVWGILACKVKYGLI